MCTTMLRSGQGPALREGATCPESTRGEPMTIRRVSSGPGLPAGFPFSLASEGNGILFISGMPAVDESGTFAPGTFEEETERAWAVLWRSPPRVAAARP